MHETRIFHVFQVLQWTTHLPGDFNVTPTSTIKSLTIEIVLLTIVHNDAQIAVPYQSLGGGSG